jgi:hypothetical protein
VQKYFVEMSFDDQGHPEISDIQKQIMINSMYGFGSQYKYFTIHPFYNQPNLNADFDGDDIPDLVTAEEFEAKSKILINVKNCVVGSTKEN